MQLQATHGPTYQHYHEHAEIAMQMFFKEVPHDK